MPPQRVDRSEPSVYAQGGRASDGLPPRGRLLRRTIGSPQPEEASMAHAKDKGASKNVKKKAQKSVKEKRAEKKAKKGTVSRSIGE
jgi:hypothetical protein